MITSQGISEISATHFDIWIFQILFFIPYNQIQYHYTVRLKHLFDKKSKIKNKFKNEQKLTIISSIHIRVAFVQSYEF